MDSEIGYLLSEPIQRESKLLVSSTVLAIHEDGEETSFDLSRFWTIESFVIFPESFQGAFGAG